MSKFIQSSFARGEIATAIQGRVDIRQYQTGLNKARNCVVHHFGNISNRAGLEFIAPVKDHTLPPRLLPFQFKTTDTHVIEFGHEYVRIIRNDTHVTNDTATVTAATQTNPVVITLSSTLSKPVAEGSGDANSGDIYINSMGGMTEMNGQRFRFIKTGGFTYAIYDIFGDPVNGTTFGAYTAGGTLAIVFEITTPYQQSELRDIKFVQTADIVTLVHPNHPPRELRRSALDNWSLVDISFRPTVEFPEDIATAGGAGGVDAYYQITAIDEDGQESLPGIDTTGVDTITGITNANPAVVTTGAHGLASGDVVHITGIVGMEELNDRRFTVDVVDATHFRLNGEDSTSYGVWTSGGSVYATFIFNTNSTTVTVSWTAVTGAVRYRIFKKSSGVFGFIGSTESTSFVDPGTITPDTADTPPRLFEPFLGEDNFPSAVGFHQQRMVFGGSHNDPDTTFYSVIGDFNNFTHSIPFQDDDSFSTTLASGQINDIRHYVSSSKDLLALTSGQEWAIQGTSGDSRFSIDTIQQVPQTTWGTSQVPPIVIDGTVLFVTAAGHHVRSTAFSFEHDHYVANELSLLVPHLFEDTTIVEWGRVKDPDTIIYCVKDDGQVAALVYNEEQEIIAWSRWDTDGEFESVATIEPSIDEHHEQAYFVIKRTINNHTVRYIERTTERFTDNIRDAYFVDAGTSYDAPVNITSVSLTNPAVITAPVHGLTTGDRVDIFDIVWRTTFDNSYTEIDPAHLNTGRYIATVLSADTFSITDEDGNAIDGTAFSTYIQGGEVRKAVSTISGLYWLPNTPVSVLADGNVIVDLTVSARGTLTLSSRFSRVHIGLRYITDIQTLSPEFDPPGTGSRNSTGTLKKVANPVIRFERTRGLFIGPDENNLKEMKQREFEVMGDPTTMFTGDKQIPVPSKWGFDGRLFMRQPDPLPLTILAIIFDFETEDG